MKGLILKHVSKLIPAISPSSFAFEIFRRRNSVQAVDVVTMEKKMLQSAFDVDQKGFHLDGRAAPCDARPGRQAHDAERLVVSSPIIGAWQNRNN